MVITDLAGLPGVCSSAPDRGITDIGAGADGARAGADAGSSVAVGLWVDAASLADADMRAVRLAAFTVASAVDFMAALWPMVGAGSTVAAVDSTVVAGTVADTGNCRLIGFDPPVGD